MSEQLKPCPFCGYPCVIVQTPFRKSHIGCDNSECTLMPWASCEIEDEQVLIDAWNSRNDQS